MKTNHTNEQLQAAIDGAFAKGYTVEIHRLDLSPSSFYWDQEAPNRLSLIKSALDALPEPMDEESMLLNLLAVIHRDGGHYQSEHGTRKAVEDACKEWQRLISIVEKTWLTEPESLLSQLRPIAEAGPVPEGCVRVTAFCFDGKWIIDSKGIHPGDTNFADIRLPAPAEKPDPYAELKAAHAAGKVIQHRFPGHLPWSDTDKPEFLKSREYRIKPETFEAHVRTWTKHTPGDPMPCDGSSAVMALLGDGTFWTQQAEDWNWNNNNNKFDIIGWRYADKPMLTKPISLPLADGMSLRDYFAGQALAGYLASWSDDSDPNFFEPYHAAKTSYAYADAMLAAREVKP